MTNTAPSRARSASRALLVATALAAALGGCLKTRYVAQAAAGQLDLFARARPIDEVLDDPETDERTRILLAEVPRIRAYGAERGLEDSQSYTKYVALDRHAVVWFLAAARPLSLEPKQWSFPIAGSFPMLGWFDFQDALAYKRKLERAGWDVYVRTVSAYSTGGWFRDPILSTMLSDDEDAWGDLVNVVLHESVHATILVADQANFNESVASFIADGMTEGYLTERFGPDAEPVRLWREDLAEDRAYAQAMLAAYDELEALYASDKSDREKLATKRRVLERLEREQDLVRTPNNATLIGFKTYNVGFEAMERLLDACEGSWPRFIEAVKGVGGGDFTEDLQEDIDPVFDRLAKAGC